jgi:site-specific recombinase XerD
MPKFVTLTDFFEGYYLPLKLRSRSKNTIRLYRHSVRSFGKFLDRPAKLTDLTDDTVSAYLAWLVSWRRYH